MGGLERSRRSVVKERLQALGVRPSKRLGQNFLADPATVDYIVSRAELSGQETVLEIGPGLGALTERLASRAHTVIAIEQDLRLAEELRAVFADSPGVTVHQGDATAIEFEPLLPPTGEIAVVSSLPYSAGGVIIGRILREIPRVSRQTLVVQREVAGKLTAGPGDEGYGMLSLVAACYAEARVVGRVGRGSFYPVPEVESAVVSLATGDRPPTESVSQVLAVATAALGQRRKVLTNALRSGLGLERETVRSALASAGIDGDRRGETLTLTEFRLLGDSLVAAGWRCGETKDDRQGTE